MRRRGNPRTPWPRHVSFDQRGLAEAREFADKYAKGSPERQRAASAYIRDEWAHLTRLMREAEADARRNPMTPRAPFVQDLDGVDVRDLRAFLRKWKRLSYEKRTRILRQLRRIARGQRPSPKLPMPPSVWS